MYIKLFKCVFNAEKIDFLGFKVSQYGISINLSKVDTITTWLFSKTHCKIQIFFEFANFYHCVIQSFNKIFSGLSRLLKKSMNGSLKSIKFVMTNKAVKLFDELKLLFICISILIYYDLAYHTMLKCNISRFAIGTILSQLVGKTGQ